MNFDQETFNSIYDDLIFNKNEEIGSVATADDSIRLGWLLGQSSIALNHPTDATCAIHEENLQKYKKFTLGKQPKPPLNSEAYCGIFTLNVDDFRKYLQLPCLGNCKLEKISKEDIDTLLKADPLTGQSLNNKRSFSDLQPTNEQSEKKFVFRQSNFGSISRGSTSSSSTSTSTGLAPTKNSVNDGLFDSFHSNRKSSNAVEKRVFQRPIFVSNDINEQRERRANFHDTVLAQRNIQQRNDQNVMPSSNGQRDVASDSTMNANGSNATRNNYSFITAREELQRQNLIKNGQNPNQPSATPLFAYGKSTKTLGTRRSVRSNFVPPITPVNCSTSAQPMDSSDSDVDPRLKNIEPKMIELIQNEIMHHSSTVDWDDIAGLEYAKRTIQEAVVYPLLRPDIFTGLRGPPRGILLFGPPGTGKTLIGRCIASRSRSTFFSISASSLTSKWIGEGEKMVRALFAVAAVNQPAVIFVDEIDSLLSQRSETEHESSRRLKTEFLVQLDGARTTEDERILIVGATNRPHELDEAARRRLTKRLYIPLPELDARIQILTLLLKKERNQISTDEVQEIGRLTEGFSGADMKTLCHEALMGPIRNIRLEDMASIDVNDVRLVNLLDFTNALKRVRASVSQDDLIQYEKWDSTYGLGAGK